MRLIMSLQQGKTQPAKISSALRTLHMVAASALLDRNLARRTRLCILLHPKRGIVEDPAPFIEVRTLRWIMWLVSTP